MRVDRQGLVAVVSVLVGLIVVMGACGDDSGSGSGNVDLPDPPPGGATVGGRLEIDGERLADHPVGLAVPGTEGLVDETRTDADGVFAFPIVAPGSTYTLGTEVAVGVVEGGKECSAPGFAGSFHIIESGGFGLSLTSDAFTVEAGEHLVKDIVLNCD